MKRFLILDLTIRNVATIFEMVGTVFPGIAAYRQLYPIPQTEIENVSDKDGWQNEGYTVE